MSSFQIARFIELISVLGNELAPSKARVQHKLSQHEFSCLKLVDLFGPISMSHLSQMLDTSSSRASQLVNALEDHNLVRRISGEDKRSIAVKVQPRGARLISEQRKHYLMLSKKITSQLSKDQVAVFEELCGSIQLTYQNRGRKT